MAAQKKPRAAEPGMQLPAIHTVKPDGNRREERRKCMDRRQRELMKKRMTKKRMEEVMKQGRSAVGQGQRLGEIQFRNAGAYDRNRMKEDLRRQIRNGQYI